MLYAISSTMKTDVVVAPSATQQTKLLVVEKPQLGTKVAAREIGYIFTNNNTNTINLVVHEKDELPGGEEIFRRKLLELYNPRRSTQS